MIFTGELLSSRESFCIYCSLTFPPHRFALILRSGTIPACFDSGGGAVTLLNYNVLIEYEIDGANNGALINPIAFFVAEVNVSPGKYEVTNSKYHTIETYSLIRFKSFVLSHNSSRTFGRRHCNHVGR